MSHCHYSPIAIPETGKGVARALLRALWYQFGGDGPVPKNVSAPLKIEFRTEGLSTQERTKCRSRILRELDQLPLDYQELLTFRQSPTEFLVTANLHPEMTREELSTLAAAINALLPLQARMASNPGLECDFPFYQIRGLSCMCAPYDQRWEVVGQDLFLGGAGVIEWATGPADATAVWERMRAFPERFKGLKIAPSYTPPQACESEPAY